MRLVTGAWQRTLSFAMLLLLWELASLAANPRKLPSPQIVAGVLVDGIADGSLPYHVGITLARVAVSFVLAMVIGIAIGIAMEGGRASTASSTAGWCCSSTYPRW